MIDKKLKKQLTGYIRESLSKGYSLKAIRKALIKYGYEESYIDNSIKTYKKQSNITNYSTTAVLMLLLFSLGLLLIEPTQTGFVTINQESGYSDNVNLTTSNDYEYTWFIGNIGELKSLKLDGSISKEGSAKVYLEYNNEYYLVFDSDKLSEEGIGTVTGLVISDGASNASLDNQSEETVDVSDESEPINNNSLNKKIIITTQGGGSKAIEDVFEFNVDGSFNWNVDYSKVCTKWDVNSVSLCYGSDECCALLGLESLGSWDDSFYLSYGRYDSGLENIVKAQVIYANYSLDIENPYSDIVYSDVSELDANFYYERINFRDICIDTCLLPGLNATSYTLRFVIENATLNIGSIKYSIEEEVNISRNVPKLIKEFKNITIYKNEYAMIDLSEHFSDEDNDQLTYSAYETNNITVSIKDSIATLTPNYNYTGKDYTFFRVSDGYYNINSNVFSIRVIEKPLSVDEVNISEKLIKPRIVINKPVKWVKIVNASTNVINLSINISSYALNVSVKDTKEDKIISEDKLKINDKGVIKNASVYMAEKRISQIEKIEERLQDKKISIIQKKPTAKEEISSINKELLQLQNERNKLSGYAVVSKEKKGLLTKFFEWLFDVEITGYAVQDKKDKGKHLGHNKTKHKDKVEVIIEEPVEEIEIEYYTEAPLAVEENISDFKKIITISAPDELAYTDILAYTNLPTEAHAQSVHLYRLFNDSKEEVEIDKYDKNNNSLMDYIEWVVPHLSNATYEVSITILNVHSYPSLYGNWTILFNTTGISNLTITATFDPDYTPYTTRWSNFSEDSNLYDLKFIEIKCGNKTIGYEWQGEDCWEQECSVFIKDYNCNETAQEISKILTARRHVLKFNFGGQEAYAYNDVSVEDCRTISSPGMYNLSKNITDSSSTKCIQITANDVTLDCKGNKIDGNDIVDYGIYIYRDSATDTNITIKNCTITDWNEAGIYLYNANNNSLENLNVSSNPEYGIYLSYSSNNTIIDSYTDNNHRGLYIEYGSENIINNLSASNNSYGIYIDYSSNNTIINSSANNNDYGIKLRNNGNNTVDNCYANNNVVYGIHLQDSAANTIKNSYMENNNYGIYIDGTKSNNSLIYNNFFNSTQNYAAETTTNSWNTTKTSGTNIVGSIFLGGNYWANSSGIGHSDNCTDADGDRLCDLTYNLSTGNIDYLPLTYPDTTFPTINFTWPTTATGNYSQNWIAANVTANDTYLSAIVIYLYNTTQGLNQSNVSTTSPFFINFTSLQDGTYYLNATANDTTNNKNSTETRIITLDTIEPSWNNNQTNATLMKINGNATFNITVTDNGTGLNYYIFSWNGTGIWDNATKGRISGNSTKLVINKSTNLSQGNTIGYRWYVNDTVNNLNKSLLRTFTVANTPPEPPQIIFPVDGKNYSNITAINYSVGDADGDSITYEIYINGSLNTSIVDANLTYWNASDGFYNLTVTANDEIDSSANSSVVHFRLDSTPPSWSGNQTNATLMKINGNATFNITVLDYGSGLSYYIFSWNGTGVWDNSTNGSISGSSARLVINKSTNLSQGNVIGYRWYANDSANNWNESLLRTFTVANTEITFSNAINGSLNFRKWENLTANITINDADGDLSSYIFSHNNSDSWSNDSLVSISGTTYRANSSFNISRPQGSYICWKYYANDTANSIQNSSEYCFTVANTPPEPPQIIFPVDGKNYSNITAINYSVGDADGDSITYEIYINGSLNTSIVDANLTYWNASDGFYNLTVTANDEIDSSANSSVVHFRLDSTPPSWSGNQTNATLMKINGNATFNITVLDYGSGLSYYIFSWNGTGEGWLNDTNGSISGSSAKLVINKSTNLSKGNTIGYRWYANDSLDQWNKSLLRTFTLANTAPTTPNVTYPVDGKNYSDIPYINYSSTDANGDPLTYTLYINNTINVTGISTNVTDWNASDGFYNLTVTANDGIDSSANSSVVHFRLDSTAPTVTIIYPTNGSNISSNSIDLNASGSEIELTYYWVINGTVNSTSIDTNSTLNASDGYYNLTVFAYDGLQNGSDTVYFRLDTTAPSWNNNQTNATLIKISGNATFNITVSDYGSGLSYYIFSWNGTGVWDNATNGSISGSSAKLVINKSTTLSQGNTIGYRWYANDSANNWNESLLRTFTVANTAPATPNVTYPVDGKNYSDIPYINYSSTDADGDTLNYSIYINGTLNITTLVNVTDWNASDGFYNLTVSASDGTQSSANSSVIHFRLDSIAPTVHLISPPNKTKTNSSNQTFSCNITDNNEITNITLYVWNSTNNTILTNTTNLSGVSYNASWNYTLPHSGIFTWNCLGYDAPGSSVWSEEGNYTIDWDTIPPNITASSPSGIINASKISLEVTTDENATCRYIPHTEGNISTIYANMSDNFTDNNTNHNKTLTLSNGYYEFYARCRDIIGNVMNRSENISFTINAETVTTPVTGGGGGGGGVIKSGILKKVLLKLDAPESKTLFSGDQIEVLITLENKGEVLLYSISLEAKTNAPNITLGLSNNSFDKLDLDEKQQLTLNIKSLTDPKAHIGINRYFVNVNASVGNPQHETSVQFFIDVKERYHEARIETLKHLQFAQDLFKQNPECLEFEDILKQAEDAYYDSDYDKTNTLIDSAIEACRDLIASKEEREIEVLAPKKKTNMLIFTIEMIVLLALILAMLYYYKKMKEKPPRMPIEAESELEPRFNYGFNETWKFIRDGNLSKAKEGYLRLYSLYKMINYSSLPYSKKYDCRQKLWEVYSELSEIARYHRK